jgi:hypothetical protein
VARSVCAGVCLSVALLVGCCNNKAPKNVSELVELEKVVGTVQHVLSLKENIDAQKEANLKIKEVSLALQVQVAKKGEAEADLYVVGGASVEKTDTAVVTLKLCPVVEATGQCAQEHEGLSQFLSSHAMTTDRATTHHETLKEATEEWKLPFSEAVRAAMRASQLALCGTPKLAQKETDAEFDFEIIGEVHGGLDIKVWGVGVTAKATLKHEKQQQVIFTFEPADTRVPVRCERPKALHDL